MQVLEIHSENNLVFNGKISNPTSIHPISDPIGNNPDNKRNGQLKDKEPQER